MERRYGRDRNFDGIHLNGPSGKPDYTESVLNILYEASLCDKPKYQKAPATLSNRIQSQNQYKKIPPVWSNQNYNRSNYTQHNRHYHPRNDSQQQNYDWKQQNRSQRQNVWASGFQPWQNNTPSRNRPSLLPTPVPSCATGGNREPINNIYNVPTFNRFNAFFN